MADPEFMCKTCDAEIYSPSHILEHKSMCSGYGWCEIVGVEKAPIETPENSRFDITDDPRSA